jgi:hypothetical protein
MDLLYMSRFQAYWTLRSATCSTSAHWAQSTYSSETLPDIGDCLARCLDFPTNRSLERGLLVEGFIKDIEKKKLKPSELERKFPLQSTLEL